jgi:hypothetical protein
MLNYQTESPNYTQRNNPSRPESACNVSAAVTAAVAAGWVMPEGPTNQDDENFMLFIRGSKECLALCDKLNKAWHTGGETWVPPEQCHAVLDLGLNLWLGIPIAHTVELAKAEQIMQHIDEGGACFTSGKMPTTRGHFIAIVSYNLAPNEVKPSSWIIKDPWGDYRTDYKSHYGNNVVMSYIDYLKYIRPAATLEKLMHFVKKNPDRK